ncbi:MAG: hypothetical protein M1275_01295 [Patescibacteria group bacterium]|nr:hypothetical protein [Patescibacteria group bacterium]
MPTSSGSGGWPRASRAHRKPTWAEAEALVAKEWRAWFSPHFLESLYLTHVSAALAS